MWHQNFIQVYFLELVMGLKFQLTNSIFSVKLDIFSFLDYCEKIVHSRKVFCQIFSHECLLLMKYWTYSNKLIFKGMDHEIDINFSIEAFSEKIIPQNIY